MSRRDKTPWDRFVVEWNAQFWNLGLDIVSTVIFRDEGSDRVAGVYYLDDKSILTCCYDEDDVLHHNLSDDWDTSWPYAVRFTEEERALDAATDWIDKGELPDFDLTLSWYNDYILGKLWDREEESS